MDAALQLVLQTLHGLGGNNCRFCRRKSFERLRRRYSQPIAQRVEGNFGRVREFSTREFVSLGLETLDDEIAKSCAVFDLPVLIGDGPRLGEAKPQNFDRDLVFP